MAIVYDKAGKAHKCGDEDAKILIESGHFTKSMPKPVIEKAVKSVKAK